MNWATELEFRIGVWVRDRLGSDQRVLVLGGHRSERAREEAMRGRHRIRGRRTRQWWP